ncbi:MAG: bifunctional UDP-N-acetylmuramoyl-tripeptide:D-alanyl-D-alanine ligase/alanine racemase [Chitinophagaceae bacterium]|nr:MAG: bifunctional UDP-N-acetylmuramoyl-tripeptide:D-alanyl-D-alanine ligase/alanine racemase [Chitinophagaceae bacterium]
MYTAAHIASILGSPSVVGDRDVVHILLDSRKVFSPEDSVFFAVKGARRDGASFIPELYAKQVRCFVVSAEPDRSLYPGADFIVVADVLAALQQLAATHRARFSIPVIGITGSNGKTIVKEWLYQLLEADYNIVRSPRSYNSQTGVPLSVWEMDSTHTLAIFEAGISLPGEMEQLEPIIRPTTGVFTNLGEAHSEGFPGAAEKAAEKAMLFRHTLTIIYNANNPLIEDAIAAVATPASEELVGWKDILPAILRVVSRTTDGTHSIIHAEWKAVPVSVEIPFADQASQENAISCWAVMLQMGYAPDLIATRMKQLQPVNMRLEVKQGINNCVIINDSYSADPDSLRIALGFMQQQAQGRTRTVILSDFLQSASTDRGLYSDILESLSGQQVSDLICIGPRISIALQQPGVKIPEGLRISSFESTEQFIRGFRASVFRDQIILVKGARIFHFEEIVRLLEFKRHQTLLEINLRAIVHNVKFYQGRLKPTTRIMAMVKAFAYGAGGAEIAGVLQFHKVDYLGVAYADEGVDLRKAGISLPVMVINPEPASFEAIIDYNLEPVLYSMELLDLFEQFVRQEALPAWPVHIEIETGMNRLGFAPSQVELLTDKLKSSSWLKVQSVFSHLAASEDGAEDVYTRQQFATYQDAVKKISAHLGYPFIRHISNSAAIMRLPELELDMVRLGIGLYGVDSSGKNQPLLQPAATLRSTVAQLKYLKAGDTVGYNRRGKIDRDTTIATVRIGYADGYSRRLGYGAGKMFINGYLAPVIGTVSMDMTMVDVTDIPHIREGDDVIIFGKELPVQQVAAWAGTIPYEIMTGISQRVQRVYYEE